MAKTAAKGGFYIQNTTPNIVHFATTDKKFDTNLRPNGDMHDTLWVPADYEDEPIVHKLLARKVIVKVEQGDVFERGAFEAEQAAIEEADALALGSIDQSEKEALIEVDCDAVTKAGAPCKVKAYVTKGHRESGAKCYCHLHESLNEGFKNETETTIV